MTTTKTKKIQNITKKLINQYKKISDSDNSLARQITIKELLAKRTKIKVDLFEKKSQQIEIPLEEKTSKQFHSTTAWKTLKRRAYKKYGRRCARCASNESLTVDHVKPRSKYPSLSLDLNNLQILCNNCNSRKGLSVIDYRKR